MHNVNQYIILKLFSLLRADTD